MAERSPLHSIHVDRGARFVDFGGWEMPVQYDSVLSEHATVRNSCGWFDVSHLGRCRVPGDSLHALRHVLCNDVQGLEPFRTHYTMALNGAGGIIDDIIVWRRDNDFIVLPNAGNHHRIMSLLHDEGATVEDWRPNTCTIAVQGPEAPEAIEKVTGVRPRRSRVGSGRSGGTEVLVGGSGYTGEPGGEIIVDADAASGLITALEEVGAKPCGLGARDTLRLEAGLPLWGQDIDETTNPLEASLDFAIAWDHEFRGRDALVVAREKPLAKRLIGFRTEGRLIPRHGHRLRSGSAAGEVTSGNFSPTLQHGIGMGYISDVSPGQLEIEIRGGWHPVELVDLPFYRRK